MNKQQLSIGVFDSGMGGLTVLRALRRELPTESFIYLGDTARLPYGTKSRDTVKRYAGQMAQLLMQRHIKALVIACNTATTSALEYLQETLPDILVVGVVAPGAAAAVAATRNHHITVLATETTIATDAYQDLIRQRLSDAVIHARACSVLVALAEEGMTGNALAKEALQHYLSELATDDTVLLGCTHFPVFKDTLKQLLPQEVQVVDSADATAAALKQRLLEDNLAHPNVQGQGDVHYLVTDSVKRFQKVGEIFLQDTLQERQIELVDIPTIPL
ncbi:MAG: glutamate racemase [Gammaproteobacteria bacterium]|nr:glutamate racemase [Gammaproteobacteria bacterium]